MNTTSSQQQQSIKPTSALQALFRKLTLQQQQHQQQEQRYATIPLIVETPATKQEPTDSLQQVLLASVHKSQSIATVPVGKVAPRISKRPSPILIPMVRVHNERLQEIELLTNARKYQQRV